IGTRDRHGSIDGIIVQHPGEPDTALIAQKTVIGRGRAERGPITTSFDFGGLGGIAFEGESIGSLLEVTVKYTYEVVPTPGSAAVLGLGGLVAMRRRR
ncbi:MAG: hypothetical protein AAF235_11005, partial [Planctomycetota bacterium]